MPLVAVNPAPEWEDLFRPTQGWLGSDCAYSISLGGERLLWLYDDTFVGRLENGRRRDVVMVRNTIAIQKGLHPSKAKVRFVVRRDKDGRPVDLIVPPDGVGWFWFGHGILVGERLWIFLWQFEPTNDPSPFNFRLRNSWLAEVPNYADEPEDWQWEFHRLPFFEYTQQQTRCFGNAVVRQGEEVFIYGVVEDRQTVPLKRGLLVAKAPAGRLEDFSAWRFFADGQWTTNWRSASAVGGDIGFEFTVSFVPALRQFVLVYSPADLSPVVRLRWAPAPFGPWSEPQTVYRCPQVEWHPSIFCYAAKAHPDLSGGDELVVSYASNSSEFWRLLEDSRLYFPHFIRLRFQTR